MDPRSLIARNIAAVQERIESACARSGRNPADVTVLPVTKTLRPEAILQLHALGFHNFGENRWQVAGPKIEALPDLNPAPAWHFIGHLQGNKVAKVVGHFSLIHSVDSLDLAERIHKRAESLGIRQAILLQIKSGAAAAKSGINNVRDLERILVRLPELRGVDCRGLMTMADADDDEAALRATFGALRDLGENTRNFTGLSTVELSMGMSGDFEIAVECGATLVRIGSLLWEGLSPDLRL